MLDEATRPVSPEARTDAETVIAPDPLPARPLEGLPIGNGVLGALVFIQDGILHLALDRIDLWDTTPQPETRAENFTFAELMKLRAAGDFRTISKRFDEPYGRPSPTRIPAARLALRSGRIERIALQVGRGVVAFAGVEASGVVAISAVDDVGLFRISGRALQPALIPLAFGGPPGGERPDSHSGTMLWDLGLSAPTLNVREDGADMSQQGRAGILFAVALRWRSTADGVEGVWTIASGREDVDPVALAACRADAAMRAGFDALMNRHVSEREKAWRDAARLELPDKTIADHYAVDMHLLASSGRPRVAAAPLQGPWSTGDGDALPPWKGDYHHDLNTQMIHWPAYAGGLNAQVEALTDWLWQTREACREFAQRYFDAPGIAAPMTADIENRPLGGWPQHGLAITTIAWLAQHFYLQWRYQPDPAFLRTRAYPYLTEVCRFLEHMTERRSAAGRRMLAVSTSPELHDNRPEAWFDDWTNFDLALVSGAFAWAAEMAEAVSDRAAAKHWRRCAAELPELALDDQGGLAVAPGAPICESHRHLSHLAAIYPFGILDPERPADHDVIRASIARVDSFGTSRWAAFTYAWRAILCARAGDGDAALASLRILAEAFTLPNGLNANGDYKNLGHSEYRAAEFTLEANGGFAAAVHELLLSARGDVVRVLPALPTGWRNLRFDRLRAERGLMVSARVAEGRLQDLRVVATCPGGFRIRWPNGGVDVTLGAGEERTLLADGQLTSNSTISSASAFSP